MIEFINLNTWALDYDDKSYPSMVYVWEERGKCIAHFPVRCEPEVKKLITLHNDALQELRDTKE
jgi:hypothetical protein